MLAVWHNLFKVLVIMTCGAFVHACCLYCDITMSYASVPCSCYDDARQHHLYCLLQCHMTLLTVGKKGKRLLHPKE